MDSVEFNQKYFVLFACERKSRDMKKYSKETVVGIFVVIGLLCLGYMTIKLKNVMLFGGNTYSLFGKFTSVEGLREGSLVTMLGQEIGRVGKFTMDQENQQVVVEFKIKNGIEIYDDAIALIKQEGLLGDKYVAIIAGRWDDLNADKDMIADLNSPTNMMDFFNKFGFKDLESGFPTFPWPPPEASAKEKVPDQFLRKTESRQTLHDIDKRICLALNESGYFNKSYYVVPRGFAIATRLEQINADGTPKAKPQRWAAEVGPLKEFSLTAYLRALFTSNAGYFRIIVFIVTDAPFRQVDMSVDMDQASEWLHEGLDKLPSAIRSLSYSKEHSCTALVYEFEKIDGEKAPVAKIPGRHTGRKHLIESKLWSKLERK